MKSLSKSDKYAIEFLHKQNKTDKEISGELGLSVAQIKKVIKNLVTTDNKTTDTKTDKTKNLMIRQTSAKKNNTVSIMTESAAQLSDEFIKTIPSATKNTDGYIYRRPE